MEAGVSGDVMEDKGRMRLFSALPLLIFAFLAGTIVIVVNPGLYWDDWVWIHQEPAENIRIGNELGIWWAGHLSNAIYASGKPVLLLRIVSLVAWAVGAVAVSYTLWRRGYLDQIEAIFLAALLCSAHVGIVRFITSVAMYNVYIASFWIGCAVFASGPRRLGYRLAALPFFFFSFHLNSLVLIYTLVLLALLVSHLRDTVCKFREREHEPEHAALHSLLAASWTSIRGVKARIKLLLLVFPTALRTMLKQDWVLIVLPISFILIVKFVSLALSTVLANQQRIYSDYNNVQVAILLHELLNIPRFFILNIMRYFDLAIVAVPSRILILLVGIGIALALMLPRKFVLPSLKKACIQISIGLVLFAFCVYPYLIVGKPPIIFDFQEARHILPGMPGILLAVVGIVNIAAIAMKPVLGSLAIPARNGALGAIVGMGVAGQFKLGTDLAKDWIRQEAIANFHLENKQRFDRYGTFLFNDHSIGFTINARRIWNYEYTGGLINVFKAKSKLGISVQEYESWPKLVPPVVDPVFRKRYNLTHYDPRLPQIVVDIANSSDYPELRDVLSLLRKSLHRERVGHLAARYFTFKATERIIEADLIIDHLNELVANIESFRSETGVYPYTTAMPPRGNLSEAIARRAPNEYRVPAYLNEIPRGSPRQGFRCGRSFLRSPPNTGPPVLDRTEPNVPMCIIEVNCLSEGCGFLYFSDGIDYKLVFIRPIDLPYVRQAFGDMIDPMRDAYGYWTKGAARW